jgi:Holliday junction DNA helicase RuvB
MKPSPIDPHLNNNDEEELLFTSLRASSWDEFLGQENIKKSLKIAIDAARQRQEAVDHILFYGPAGLGKTTLAQLIAKEMGVNFHITSGTALSKTSDLAAILTNLEDGDVLFIDEIHRLPKAVEETLYPAMEDFALDIVIGKGPSARTVRLDLAKFTLVGATTRFGLLTGPFRDRFGLIHRLEFYKPEELEKIIEYASKKLNCQIDRPARLSLAKRARGTPRIALKLLKRVRDFAQVLEKDQIDEALVNQALEIFEIDQLGLDENDRRLLMAMINKHDGKAVGLKTLSASISEDAGTVEEVLEPYLLQIGFIRRTPKGRIITNKAYRYFGITPPESNQ